MARKKTKSKAKVTKKAAARRTVRKPAKKGRKPASKASSPKPAAAGTAEAPRIRDLLGAWSSSRYSTR